MTSFRVLTAEGLAAVAVIRLRGDLRGLPLRTRAGHSLEWPGRDRVLVTLLRDEGRVLDEVLVRGTRDGAELHLHGGAGVLDSVTRWLVRHGCRPDSTAVEAPAPASLRHVRALLSSREGPLAMLAAEAREAVRAGSLPAGLRQRLGACQRRQTLAARLTVPARVRIVGAPNAGKSTLFNAMLGSERALVSPEAGTTRDAVTARLLLRGVPVELQDTAGGSGADLRPADADLFVHVLHDERERPLLLSDRSRLLEVCGRADIGPRSTRAPGVSGRTGEGVAQLLEAIADRLGLPQEDAGDILAPVDPALRELLAAALALADRPA